jgi:hypothetical protein
MFNVTQAARRTNGQFVFRWVGVTRLETTKHSNWNIKDCDGGGCAFSYLFIYYRIHILVGLKMEFHATTMPPRSSRFNIYPILIYWGYSSKEAVTDVWNATRSRHEEAQA